MTGRRLARWALAAALALIWPAAVAAQVTAPADVAAAAPPSAAWMASRVVGALVVVGGLLAVTLVGLRALWQGGGRLPAALARLEGARQKTPWLAMWRPAGGGRTQRLEIVDRRHVGPKESVCVVRAGREQFLIGVTSHRISLLGRLAEAEIAEPAPAAPTAAVDLELRIPARETIAPAPHVADPLPADEPAVTEFARGLAERTVLREPDAEESFRALLARSRERLSRINADVARRDAVRRERVPAGAVRG